MSLLSVREKEVEVSVTETNVAYKFDATARLADEGGTPTLASIRTVKMTSTVADVAVPDGVIVSSALSSPAVLVTLNPSLLKPGRYSLICTPTSSNGNDQAMQVDVVVKN